MANEEQKKAPPKPQQPDEAKSEPQPVSNSSDEITRLRDQIDDAFRDAPSPWINGTAIGFLPNVHKQPGIFVFVDPSAPECERAGIEKRVQDIPNVQLLRVSRFIGLQTPNPVPPGKSISTYAPFRYNLPPVNAGTLGARVVVNGQEYILGSNHVLAHNGRAREGTAITVPGPIDDLTAGPMIAKRSYFVSLETAALQAVSSRRSAPNLTPIQRAFLAWPSQGPVNQVDCALAEVVQPSSINASHKAEFVPLSALTPADLANLSRERVNKKGRATGETTSRVRLFDLRGYIGFTFGTCYFEGMVGTYDDDRAIFAAPGDSGSVAVVDQSVPGQFRGQAVGLITARAYVFDDLDNFIGYIIAMCPMATVADELAKVMPPVQGRNLTKGDFEFFV